MARNVYGLDLGTYDIKIFDKKKDRIWHAKNVIAMKDKKYIFSVGDDAYEMYEKAPGNIQIIFPMKNGVIARFDDMQYLLGDLLKEERPFIRGAEYVIAVPTDVTEVEKKAVEDATLQAGAREVSIIEEPIAAAIGAGIDISKPCGNMIVDIGGGTSDIAVISLGGTVVSASIKIAGDDFDEALVRYMRKKHNLLIGERTAEDIKIKIGTAFKRSEVDYMDVRGRNLVTGLPKTVTVTSTETEEALRETTGQIVEAVISVLERTPPELSADILDRGIMLTGGGSMLRGMEELIEEKTGINTMTADDPMKVVAIGTGEYVEFMGDRKGI